MSHDEKGVLAEWMFGFRTMGRGSWLNRCLDFTRWDGGPGQTDVWISRDEMAVLTDVWISRDEMVVVLAEQVFEFRAMRRWSWLNGCLNFVQWDGGLGQRDVL